MKRTLSILLSLVILLAGGGGLYLLHERWSDPVITASSSSLGSINPEAETEEQTPELKDLIRTHQQLVVSIQTIGDQGEGIGSGFLYNELGDIVTNAHVLAGARQVSVRMSDTSTYPGTIIGMDIEKDIAIVRVEELVGTAPLEVDAETRADIGDEVLAFGSPLGFENTVTTGIISGLDRDLQIEQTKYVGVYQISAPITQGNSGGPLVMQSTGKVIGINSAAANSGTIGFSIPYHQVVHMLENWSANPDPTVAEIPIAPPEGPPGGNYDEDQDLTQPPPPSPEEPEQPENPYSEEDLIRDSEYIVRYFYDSVDAGDYATAYNLLGGGWQSRTSYEEFVAGYERTLGVYILELELHPRENGSGVQVSLLIEAREDEDGEEVYNSYSIVYHVDVENGVVRIIAGTGEKM
ncbi:S1C family serine protease [Paenibacillus daejeonensis]|uniref:S1C family serine protease n=1 Tax=Paenibacillus daejeonensis TaxID=135193 RepID=UPI000369ED77|nr:trypsin-like peptidase domain-containing protein [Paenibacillus daejeonensis]